MKKALIIGGTTGLGAEVSRELSVQGYKLITVGRSSVAPVESEHHVCDIGDLDRWGTTLEQINEAHEELAVLAAITGFVRIRTFNALTDSDWNETFRKNLTYVALALQKLEERLKQGRIMTTGSQWSYRKGEDSRLVAYLVAKHALRALTEDFGKRNPGTTAVHYCVPPINTPGSREAAQRAGLEKHVSGFNFEQLANPQIIARRIVEHILSTKESGTVAIDMEGNLRQSLEALGP